MCFLASQDALEVMRVTHSLTESLSHWVSVSIDFTDVTLVSEDTYLWPGPDDPEEHDDPDDRESYLVMKVIYWWKLSSDESYVYCDDKYLVMKVT